MHGHIIELLERKVDAIFYPSLTYNVDEKIGDNNYNCPVVAYYSELLRSNLDELKDHYRRGGLGDVKVKRFLNSVLQEELEPIRQRRKMFEKDIPAVYDMLKAGSEAAREVAAQTLSEVKNAMKINYFDDIEFIKAQAAKYE